MKKTVAMISLGLLFSASATASYQIGDTVSNRCWKNEKEAAVCLDDFKAKAKALLFNGGF